MVAGSGTWGSCYQLLRPAILQVALTGCLRQYVRMLRASRSHDNCCCGWSGNTVSERTDLAVRQTVYPYVQHLVSGGKASADCKLCSRKSWLPITFVHAACNAV